MKLTDFDKKNTASRALKENYDVSIDTQNMNGRSTIAMLRKVRGLINEARKSPKFYSQNHDSSFMKLVFMEQALESRLSDLRTNTRIVVENEEVEQAQVILASQDMVDSVQKMYEDVNDMIVKELPALTSSIQSEIGVNEAESFNGTVSAALNSLNEATLSAKNELQSALNSLTGQGDTGGFEEPAGGEEEVDIDVEEPGGEEELDLDLGGDEGDDEEELDLDLGGDEDLGAAGRELR